MTEPCEHLAGLQPVVPKARGCEECLALGAQWNELRVCLTCGHVGCCEDSEHAHALAHFKATAHPAIASYEPGESWTWCYVHRRYFDAPPGLPKRRTGLAAWLGRFLRR